MKERDSVEHEAEVPAREKKAKEPVAVAKQELCTPSEWREKMGLIRRRDPRLPQSVDIVDWKHQCADLLHGWSQHAYHFQSEPLLISQADYEAALKAAGEYPATPEHKPACSPKVKGKI